MSYEQFETLPLEVYPAGGANYTQCDFIDPRIDVYAQRALYQMLKQDPPSRKAALAMFAAVKAGRLGGIFQEDQQEPALRAKALGSGWWQLVPQGRDATCVTKPAGQPPILVFRKSITSDLDRVGQALRTAFAYCRISAPSPPPPSGKPCPARPVTPPQQGRPRCDSPELNRLMQECDRVLGECKKVYEDILNAEIARCGSNRQCQNEALTFWLPYIQRCDQQYRDCSDRAARTTHCLP